MILDSLGDLDKDPMALRLAIEPTSYGNILTGIARIRHDKTIHNVSIKIYLPKDDIPKGRIFIKNAHSTE